ncbi:MAG: hypothetical protein JJE34_00910 [Alphaproteobacteria bacterium]|nr:hypothetical protein [Alphaproteobacteria bacterium]
MKRRLVLTTESARHPFRKSLPMQLFVVDPKSKRTSDDQDWKLFMLSFSAFFTVFYTFIL